MERCGRHTIFLELRVLAREQVVTIDDVPVLFY